MAFCSRIGSLIKTNFVSTKSVSLNPMLNGIRCMSSSKLFIGGLSFGTDDQSLKDAFTSFGDVIEAKVITDRDTGRSRGFGFVNFASDESATSALSGMDGQELNGRNIRVSYANDRPSGGGFRGGYNSGSYGSGSGSGNFGDSGRGY